MGVALMGVICSSDILGSSRSARSSIASLVVGLLSLSFIAVAGVVSLLSTIKACIFFFAPVLLCLRGLGVVGLVGGLLLVSLGLVLGALGHRLGYCIR